MRQKKTSKRRSCIKRRERTQKRRKQRGGNCGCDGGVPIIHGGIPLNTFNNDPTKLMTSERISMPITRGGRSRKYQGKQTPYYPRKKKYIRGGDPLLGSAYNPISAFGTTSGIPFSSNTLFGISNQAPAGVADIPFFGKHNPPLV
jgi:hypothetical protein